ncbi:hypothetical protein IMSHALPRED_004577 [Imshaugia aleurites]|uniref:F-box domain-containing protein n=1 Tax=Imshaugia aleurites TaxID=172621 RepID=A0A8H3IHU8_9LECA|nr:hypothetical protein IMSHALPRED_004577 [Imshaugia aleurites]
METSTSHSLNVGDELETPFTPFQTTENTIVISGPPFIAVKPSEPPLPTIDQGIELRTPRPLPAKPVNPLTLMDLPIELRNKILGHLLPNALEIAKAFRATKADWPASQAAMYRPGNEACYTAIVRVNHQLYTEGTAVLYNRAFQVRVNLGEVDFLKQHYSPAEIQNPTLLTWEAESPTLSSWESETHDSWESDTRLYEKENPILYFPFHMVKQIQIQVWESHSPQNELFELRRTLIGFCSILYGQPSLKNVRIDFYDRFYHPARCYSVVDLLVDDDEAHPAQDKLQEEMRTPTEEEDNTWDIMSHASQLKMLKLWDGRKGMPASSHDISSKITYLEFILQPLRLLRNVGKARINLTARAEKDKEMRIIAKDCQDAMMSSGPQDEFELQFMDRCTDISESWGLETLFSDEHQ